ncbi:hypothetical protein CRUP_023336 [Coryphaenoides rupestris]|nr:hypothetical protein CRUP_023336 [Coryphaenoides rupestris]
MARGLALAEQGGLVEQLHRGGLRLWAVFGDMPCEDRVSASFGISTVELRSGTMQFSRTTVILEMMGRLLRSSMSPSLSSEVLLVLAVSVLRSSRRFFGEPTVLGWGQSIRMGGGGEEEVQPPPGSMKELSAFPCGVDGALRDLARIRLLLPSFASSEVTRLRSRSAGGLAFLLPEAEREVLVVAGFTSSTVKKEGGGRQVLFMRFRLPLRPLLWIGPEAPAMPPPRLLCCDRPLTLVAGWGSTQGRSAIANLIRLPRPRPLGISGSLEGDSQNLERRRNS